MDLPWSAPGTAASGQDAYVMASRFELTSAWRSPAFLAQALRARRQARRSPGVLGVSLRAQPLRRLPLRVRKRRHASPGSSR